MKAFVITIVDNEKSVKVADRCIRSAANFGIDVNKFKAITPKDNPELIFNTLNLPTRLFRDQYSRYLNVLSCFLSHYHLWLKCIEIEQPIIVFEHDAVVVDEIPINKPFDKFLSLGKPSYGNFKIAPKLGVNQLFSKRYLPGAHAYIVKPSAANALVKASESYARPADVFLNIDTFPWLEEYYPWPVEVKDTFTTVQGIGGISAKHSYSENYEII